MAQTPQDLVKAPRVSVDVEYNTRDLLLYAAGIGSTDPRYVYEKHADFAAFPTYPICLTFKGASYDALDFPPPTMANFPGPKLKGVKVGLDAEKYIEKVQELPRAGAKLKLVGGLVGTHKVGSGALNEFAYDLVDDSGKVYYKIISGGFSVGAQGFADAGVTYSKKISPPKASPWKVVETPTDEHVANIFRLSGDYNPLHVDPAVAKKGGFDKPILHGLCSLGHATRAVLDAVAGGDHRRYKSVQMRFASPVLPGQTLVTEIWQSSPTEFIFQTKVKETGKVSLSNGMMVLTPVASL